MSGVVYCFDTIRGRLCVRIHLLDRCARYWHAAKGACHGHAKAWRQRDATPVALAAPGQKPPTALPSLVCACKRCRWLRGGRVPGGSRGAPTEPALPRLAAVLVCSCAFSRCHPPSLTQIEGACMAAHLMSPVLCSSRVSEDVKNFSQVLSLSAPHTRQADRWAMAGHASAPQSPCGRACRAPPGLARARCNPAHPAVPADGAEGHSRALGGRWACVDRGPGLSAANNAFRTPSASTQGWIRAQVRCVRGGRGGREGSWARIITQPPGVLDLSGVTWSRAGRLEARPCFWVRSCTQSLPGTFGIWRMQSGRICVPRMAPLRKTTRGDSVSKSAACSLTMRASTLGTRLGGSIHAVISNGIAQATSDPGSPSIGL